MIDRQFKIALWNQRSEDLWGLRAEEVQGQSFLELEIGFPVVQLQKPVEQFLLGQVRNEKVAVQAINRRGQKITCYVTRTIRRDPDGKPDGVVLLMEEES